MFSWTEEQKAERGAAEQFGKHVACCENLSFCSSLGVHQRKSIEINNRRKQRSCKEKTKCTDADCIKPYFYESVLLCDRMKRAGKKQHERVEKPQVKKRKTDKPQLRPLVILLLLTS
ncbi:hypothetical protein ATANTOWER_014333 [Ataeniobius toweri]|uniref:Uncharacterized protein n=1 Tax=Ataeniobius toweri TaxID=208326 RepID=A0ABU7CKM8_9TELE|nr:hypothetical protein [Ataeniobius toweri]